MLITAPKLLTASSGYVPRNKESQKENGILNNLIIKVLYLKDRTFMRVIATLLAGLLLAVASHAQVVVMDSDMFERNRNIRVKLSDQ